MRIALVVNNFPILSETFIFNKALGLQQAGLEVTIWVHSQANDRKAFLSQIKELSPDSVQNTFFAYKKFRSIFSMLCFFLRYPFFSMNLWRQANRLYPERDRAFKAWILALPLAKGKYDIIHFEFSGLAVNYQDAFSLLRPAKIVTSCRGASEQIKPIVEPSRAPLLQKTLIALDKIHCVSRDMQSTVCKYGISEEKIFINHPSINTGKFQREISSLQKTYGHYTILTVGRLHWKKGFDVLILAMAVLLKKHIDVSLDIIGTGPEKEKLAFDIDDLGLSKIVRLLGPKSSDDVRRALQEADIYVQSSISEGLSNATLEAMSMELPVVSTRVGGMSEAIEDGVDGFLVDPRNPEQLVEKISYLIDHPQLRQSMGKNARKKVIEKFNIDAQIQKFIFEYENLVS